MGLFLSIGKWSILFQLDISRCYVSISCYIAAFFFVRYIEVTNGILIMYTFLFIINIYLAELCCIFGRALFQTQLGFNNSQNNDDLLTLLVTCHLNRCA
jgi:hypothetical protein